MCGSGSAEAQVANFTSSCHSCLVCFHSTTSLLSQESTRGTRVDTIWKGIVNYSNLETRLLQMFQCSTVWISTVSRLTTCHICLNKISVVLPNVERVSKHLQQPCLKFIVQQTPTVSLCPIDTVFILSSCKVSPGQQEAKPTQQLHLEVGRYSSQTHYQPLSHANIPALFTLEWSRRKVERAHGVFEARLGWNGAGKKVEAHVAKSPGLSLFCREEPVDGDSDESYALHSYRSTATRHIEIT